MKERRNAFMPYQEWNPYPPEAIVLVENSYEDKRIGLAKDFWWGYEEDMGSVADGVIIKARRLDRPKEASA